MLEPEIERVAHALIDRFAFGRGRHFCLGAPLTRSEAGIALRVLYERLPTLRVPAQQPRFVEALQVVLLRHLDVTWTA